MYVKHFSCWVKALCLKLQQKLLCIVGVNVLVLLEAVHLSDLFLQFVNLLSSEKIYFTSYCSEGNSKVKMFYHSLKSTLKSKMN